MNTICWFHSHLCSSCSNFSKPTNCTFPVKLSDLKKTEDKTWLDVSDSTPKRCWNLAVTSVDTVTTVDTVHPVDTVDAMLAVAIVTCHGCTPSRDLWLWPGHDLLCIPLYWGTARVKRHYIFYPIQTKLLCQTHLLNHFNSTIETKRT